MGTLKIADAPFVLTTAGIGSCVALCMFHAQTKKGALAHIMLPVRPEAANATSYTEEDLRYADAAIKVIISQFSTMGVSASALVAKLVGGASMFPEIQGRSVRVGEKNVESIKALLGTYSIRIVGEDVGGSVGRAASFDLSSGVVQVRTSL